MTRTIVIGVFSYDQLLKFYFIFLSHRVVSVID